MTLRDALRVAGEIVALACAGVIAAGLYVVMS